jgi:bifunctional non-homologous end joining protein LigD
MLATLVAKPFQQPGWTYEEKYDGDRMLGYKEGGRSQLFASKGASPERRAIASPQVGS